MAFQFLCPQGHLLEGDESQSGEQLQCPYCQSVFVVPAPDVAAPQQPDVQGDPQSGLPEISTAPDFGSSATSEESGESFALETAKDSSVVHIPCPNGHELETPRDMLGEYAMCPHCQTEFQLRLKDSREYKRDQAAEQERHQQRLGNAWMNWAIAVMVLVLLGVGLLLALTMAR